MILALLSLTLFVNAPPRPADLAERAARCTEGKWCAGGGNCTPSPTPEEPDRCAEGSDRDCALHPGCETEGACHFDRKSRKCAIKGPSSCSEGAACRIHGACKFVRERISERSALTEPRCYATDETCARSLDCQISGRCHAHEAGICIVRDDEDCRQSRRCDVYGLCVRTEIEHGEARCARPPDQALSQTTQCKRFGICGAAGGGSGCGESDVCRIFGWCGEVPNPNLNNEPIRTMCGATDCAQSEVCQKHGACTAVDGLCVVRTPVEPTCTRKRIFGFKTTASSTRPPEAMGKFDAAHVADRDSRTSWVPAADQAVGATLTLTLPRPERVVAITVESGTHKTDRFTDWNLHFTRLLAIKVSAGDTHEIGYAVRWTRLPGHRIQVLIPPTLTDTLTLELLLNSLPLIDPAPAIPELIIEACTDP